MTHLPFEFFLRRSHADRADAQHILGGPVITGADASARQVT
jgi:hypothetical protein